MVSEKQIEAFITAYCNADTSDMKEAVIAGLTAAEQAETAPNTLVDTISDEVWGHDASKDNCLVVDSDGLSEAALEPAGAATDVEPVAHIKRDENKVGVIPNEEMYRLPDGAPLYTHPKAD